MPDETRWIMRVRHVMNLLARQLDTLPPLRSRSVVLSLVLLAYEIGVDDDEAACEWAKFASSFVGRLKWQVGLGLGVHDEYLYLIDFQRHLTQASVEKYGIGERARQLEESFCYWRETGGLVGDEEYRRRHDGEEPEGG